MEPYSPAAQLVHDAAAPVLNCPGDEGPPPPLYTGHAAQQMREVHVAACLEICHNTITALAMHSPCRACTCTCCEGQPCRVPEPAPRAWGGA